MQSVPLDYAMWAGDSEATLKASGVLMGHAPTGWPAMLTSLDYSPGLRALLASTFTQGTCVKVSTRFACSRLALPCTLS